jgi:antitoxin component of MazEF toxin-antitoxin module
VIRKAFQLNDYGSIGISIPADLSKEVGLNIGDYVNIVKVGNCIHVTKVVIE